MSWVDDIRCLYCDGRLPLYRKITNGQFCSSAHRKAYWQEHERLAVERLHQTHDSLRAYRPPGAIEAILGSAAADEESSQTLAQPLPAFLAPEVVSSVATPVATPIVDSAVYSSAAVPADTIEMAEPGFARLITPPIFRLPKWLPDYLAAVDVAPMESSNAVRWPVHAGSQPGDATISAPAVPVAMSTGCNAVTPPAIETSAIYPRVDGSHPSIALKLNATPRNEELQALVDHQIDRQIPDLAGMLALTGINAQESASAERPQIAPAAVALPTQLPVNTLNASEVEASPDRAALPLAGLRRLPMSQVALAPSFGSADGIDGGIQAIDLRANVENPQFALPGSPLSGSQNLALTLPRLNLAAGSRYFMESGQAGTRQAAPFAPAAEPEGFTPATPHISLPQRKAKVMAASAGASRSSSAPAETAKPQAAPNLGFEPTLNPSAMGMLPLACNAKPSDPSIEMRPAPAALSLPQPLGTKPMRPDSKLEPLDEKPISDSVAAALPISQTTITPQSGVSHMAVWTHAIDFCKRAPRDLKMLVFAIPVLLGLALHPGLPKVRVAAPAAANGVERDLTQAFTDQWANVRQTVFNRAAVALDEDFRTGLDDWVSRDDATAAWSFDATGFVRPGPLALYRPSMNLTDYQMQFLGVLDKQALSWVVRAADYDNFYVIKLMVLKSGPLPTIGVVRYAVINGKADSRVDTIAPIDARADMLYRVRMDVRGADFSLSVQDQMVDSWSEPRLRHGGIGFFSARGEESRLRWVQVTHQYDMLGRLCAYLAPYNIPTTGGSW